MINSFNGYITNIDFFSDDIRLRTQNGNTNYKTFFGGFLSFLSLLLILASLGYFMEQFFRRKEAVIITNETFTNDVVMDNFTDYPFMVRISDSNSIVKENSKAYWKFFLTYWWSEKNMTDPKQTLIQKREFIDMVPCDINNPVHFNLKYKHMFENQTDIYTFMCPDYKKIYSIYGLYGDASPFSYLHFYLRPCRNETDDVVCENSDILKTYLGGAYFDFRTINFAMDSYSINPYKPLVHGERFLISNSIFRRIWMYYKTVYYKSDFGYIFESVDTSKFYQIDSFTNDVDLRNVNSGTGTVPYSFLWMTMLNLKKSTTFTRTYMKAQNFLANVGGIIRGITLIAYILNYIVSLKLLNIYLINHLPEVKYLVTNGLEVNTIASKKMISKVVKKPIYELKYEDENENNDDYNYEIKPKNVGLGEGKNKGKLNSKNKMENVNTENSNDNMKVKTTSINIIPYSRKIGNVTSNKGLDNINTSINLLSSKIDFLSNNINSNKNNYKERSKHERKSIQINENDYFERIQNNDVVKHYRNRVKNPDEEKIDLPAFESYIDANLVRRMDKIKLSWYHYILPDFMYSESNIQFKYYKKSLEYLMQELDIANIINKLNQFEKIKQSFMTFDQLTIFNYLFQSQMDDDTPDISIYKHCIDYSEFEKSLNNTRNKKRKDNLDEYLVSLIKI